MQITKEINAAMTVAQRYAIAYTQAENVLTAINNLRAAIGYDGFCTPDQRQALNNAQEAIMEIQKQTCHMSATEYIKNHQPV